MKSTIVLLLVAAVLVSGISVVGAQHAARSVFRDIEELKKERDRLNEEWGRLQLEQSIWALDERIGRIGKEELDMVTPDNASRVFLTP